MSMTQGAIRMRDAAEAATLAAHEAMGEVIMASFDTNGDRADNARAYGAAIAAVTALYATVIGQCGTENEGLANLARNLFNDLVMPQIDKVRDMAKD